jgi:hypothetical protein
MELAKRTLEHSLMGHLVWSGYSTTCDWSGQIVLPSFAECYERWCSNGTPFFRDRRSDAHREGRFSLGILSGIPRVGFGHSKEIDEFLEPTAPQCAAYRALVQGHERLAESLKDQLHQMACERGASFFFLNDNEFEFLLRPENILGTLDLEGVSITYHTQDQRAMVGMTFHSEIWECEHGVGAVVLGDQVIHLGVAEEAWPDSMMGDS